MENQEKFYFVTKRNVSSPEADFCRFLCSLFKNNRSNLNKTSEPIRGPFAEFFDELNPIQINLFF